MATRFYPYSKYDFVATEHYLTEQAELGWFAIRLGSTFIHFEEGTPEHMTYRFVPISTKKREAPTPEEHKLFSANDWQFVDHLDGKFHLYKTSLEEPKEIPIPQEQQQEVMAGFIKRSRHLHRTISFFLTIILFGTIFLADDYFLAFVLEPWDLRSVLFPIILIIFAPFAVLSEGTIHKRLKGYRKDISTLYEERNADHIPRPFRGLCALLQLVLQVFSVIFLISSFAESNVKDISFLDAKDTAEPIPYVSLEVLSDGNIPFEIHYYLEKSSFFAPVQYDIWLQGYIDDGGNPDGQIASMQFDYYYIPTDFLVEPVLETLVDTEKQDSAVTTVEYEGLDAVYLQDVRGDYTSFWMQKGNVIVSGYYHYAGTEEMTDIGEHLDLFADMMKP